jgi:phage shock protein C
MFKQLRRSRVNRIIGGVCGGIGEYFEIDPVIVRIAFLFTVFAGGSGVLVYIFCWIFIPETPFFTMPASTPPPAPGEPGTYPSGEPVPPIPPQPPIYPHEPGKSKTVFGIVLVVLGVMFLADNFIHALSIWKLWPLVLVILGASILFKHSSK